MRLGIVGKTARRPRIFTKCSLAQAWAPIPIPVQIKDYHQDPKERNLTVGASVHTDISKEMGIIPKTVWRVDDERIYDWDDGTGETQVGSAAHPPSQDFCL